MALSGADLQGNVRAMSPEANVRELQRKIAEGSGNLEDYRQLARTLFAAGRLDEATEIQSKALDLPLSDVERAGLIMEKAGGVFDWKEARSLAQAAINLLVGRQESPEVLVIRGLAYSVLAERGHQVDPAGGREEASKALSWLEKAIATGDLDSDVPQLSAVFLQAATMHHILDQSNQAIAYSQRALGLDADNRIRLRCLMALGRSLSASGRLADAERVLNEALQHPCNELMLPTLHFEMGLVQRELKQLRQACESFRRALSGIEMHPFLRRDDDLIRDINAYLAAVSYECGDYEEAAAAYSRVLRHCSKDDPRRPNYLLWLGCCELALARLSEARDHLTQVLNSPSTDENERQRANTALWDAHIRLAEAARDASDAETAIREYEAALSFCEEGDPYRVDVLGWLAELYFRLGRYSEARSYYEQLLALPSLSPQKREAVAARLRDLPKPPTH